MPFHESFWQAEQNKIKAKQASWEERFRREQSRHAAWTAVHRPNETALWQADKLPIAVFLLANRNFSPLLDKQKFEGWNQWFATIEEEEAKWEEDPERGWEGPNKKDDPVSYAV